MITNASVPATEAASAPKTGGKDAGKQGKRRKPSGKEG